MLSSVDITSNHAFAGHTVQPRKNLRGDLQALNKQLEEMKQEKLQLLGERAVLEDAAKRLNFQVDGAAKERLAMESVRTFNTENS